MFETIRKFCALKWRRNSVIVVIAVASFSELNFCNNKIFRYNGGTKLNFLLLIIRGNGINFWR